MTASINYGGVREEVIQELIQGRLVPYFRNDENGLQRTSVTRGFIGAEVSQFPSIFVFEGREGIKRVADNLYEKTDLITIEYFDKTVPQEMWKRGNLMAERIFSAVETDKDFRRLVSTYGATSMEVVPMTSTIVDVVVNYEFFYISKYKYLR